MPNQPAQPAAADPTFKVDEKVLCFHGPMLYEAKVLDVQAQTEDQPAHYKVHYKGWKNTWDEYVGPDRLRKMTEENIRLQNELKLNGRPPAGSSARGRPPNPDKLKKAGSEDGSMGAGMQRGQKRNRDLGLDDEESFMNRPEIKLNIHDDFKALLVDDWENVTKNQQLVPLPKKPSVTDIIEGYRDYYIKAGNIAGLTDPAKADSVNSAEKDILEEFCSGLKLYFDKSLGNSLLYRFERQQYADILKEHDASTKSMSDLYGAEHLLRLIVLMPELIAQTTMDQQSIGKLRFHIDYLLRYMHNDMSAFFTQGYEAGTQSLSFRNTPSRISSPIQQSSPEPGAGSSKTGLSHAFNSMRKDLLASAPGQGARAPTGSSSSSTRTAVPKIVTNLKPPVPKSIKGGSQASPISAQSASSFSPTTPISSTSSSAAPNLSSRALRYEKKLAEEKQRELEAAQGKTPIQPRKTRGKRGSLAQQGQQQRPAQTPVDQDVVMSGQEQVPQQNAPTGRGRRRTSMAAGLQNQTETPKQPVTGPFNQPAVKDFATRSGVSVQKQATPSPPRSVPQPETPPRGDGSLSRSFRALSNSPSSASQSILNSNFVDLTISEPSRDPSPVDPYPKFIHTTPDASVFARALNPAASPSNTSTATAGAATASKPYAPALPPPPPPNAFSPPQLAHYPTIAPAHVSYTAPSFTPINNGVFAPPNFPQYFHYQPQGPPPPPPPPFAANPPIAPRRRGRPKKNPNA